MNPNNPNPKSCENKSCFWRHGNFKTIKIYYHTAKIIKNEKNEDSNPRIVKRITTIQQCGFCGKLVMENNYD
jgi:hypothetical protein